MAVQPGKHISAIGQRHDVIGIECERAVVACQRLVVPLHHPERITAERPRGLEARRNAKRRVEARKRVAVAVERKLCTSAIDQRDGIARIERKRLLVARDRVVEPTKHLQRVAAVAVRRRHPRIERDGAVEADKSIGGSAQRVQHAGIVRASTGVLRIDLQRLADQPLRFDELAALRGDHAETVERVELTGIPGQYLPVESGGFVEAAGLMQSDSALERRL